MEVLYNVLVRIFFVLTLLQIAMSSTSSGGSSPTGYCYPRSCLDETKNSTPDKLKLTKTREFYGNYSFPIKSVSQVACKTLDALRKIEKGEPVILKNCHLADVTRKWSLQYMEKNILSQNLSIYLSPRRIFRFYRERLNTGKYPFRRPHILKFSNFSTFLKLKKEIEKADNGSRIYLVSRLESDKLTTEMQDDVFMFDLAWINAVKRRFQWGDHLSNLLAVGMPDVISTVHYDILENIFLQIRGKKRCLLFHPDSYKYLYPYPIHHPHDRHGKVNLERIDYQKFPKAKLLEGWEAILEPGDVLYIPIYWWHHFVSWRKSSTISYNFWFQPRQTPEFVKVYAPDGGNRSKKKEKLSASWTSLGLTRKVERTVAEILQDPSAVASFLREMVDNTFGVA